MSEFRKAALKGVIEMRLSSMVMVALPLTALLAGGFAADAAGQTGTGCLAIDSIRTERGVCRAQVRNGCAGALNVTVDFDVDLWDFVRHPIPPRPPGAGHEGEPAAGHYTGAGHRTESRSGLLASGAAQEFAYRADGEQSLIVTCRVRARGVAAP